MTLSKFCVMFALVVTALLSVSIFLFPVAAYAAVITSVADVYDGGDESADDNRDGVTGEEETAENGGLFGGVKDFIIGLVVPSDDFFQKEYDKLDGKLKEKLPFSTYTDTIGRLKDVSAVINGDATNGGEFDIEYAYLGETYKVGIGELIKPFLDKFRPVVVGLYVLFIAYYNYRQVMFLLRGTTFANLPVIGGGDNTADNYNEWFPAD